MRLSRSEKRAARNFARNFAAGLVQNAEIGVLEDIGLSDDQVTEAQAEMERIAKRLEVSATSDE